MLGMPLLDELHGGGEARQVAQAEEVHLQQAGLLDIPHLPLGGDDLLVLVLVRELLERHELLERPVGDHDARGMGADVAVQSPPAVGRSPAAADLGVVLVQPSQVRALP